MCGIAGLLRTSGLLPTDSATVTAMTDCLAHRGPDGSGQYVGEGVVLGHRRLSIIDLATGDQPFVSADRRLALVYNGELYNYLEIRTELKALGRTFRTESDTEVILQAYEQWGTDCLARFNGMWAFALWDSRNQYCFARVIGSVRSRSSMPSVPAPSRSARRSKPFLLQVSRAK